MNQMPETPLVVLLRQIIYALSSAGAQDDGMIDLHTPEYKLE
jgi:hypothetical protein